MRLGISAVRLAAILTLVAGAAAPRPAAGQSAPAMTLAVGTGPGRVTAGVPLAGYALVGVPKDLAIASDPESARAAAGVSLGVGFTTSGAAGATVAALQTASITHAVIPRIILERASAPSGGAPIVFDRCTVVRWSDTGAGRTGALTCASLISPHPQAAPGSNAGFDLKKNHSAS